MAFMTIPEKDNTGSTVAEKYLSDTEVNQLRNALMNGTLDIKPLNTYNQGNYCYIAGNKGIRYDGASKMQVSHDGSTWDDIASSPRTISTTAGEALTEGECCYIHTDGKAYLSDGTKVDGFVTADTALDDPCELQITGSMASFTGLSTGTKYYADTGGALKTTEDQILTGVALNSTTLLIAIHKAVQRYRRIAYDYTGDSFSDSGNGSVSGTATVTISIPANTVSSYIEIKALVKALVDCESRSSQTANGNINFTVYKTYSAVDTDIISDYSICSAQVDSNSSSDAYRDYDTDNASGIHSCYYEPTADEKANGFTVTVELIGSGSGSSGTYDGIASIDGDIKRIDVMGY